MITYHDTANTKILYKNPLQIILQENFFANYLLNLTLNEHVLSLIRFNKDIIWFGLVSLFNGISIFMGYLMPNPSS